VYIYGSYTLVVTMMFTANSRAFGLSKKQQA